MFTQEENKVDNLRDSVLEYSLIEAEKDGTVRTSTSTISLDEPTYP